MDAWGKTLGFWGIGVTALIAGVSLAIAAKGHQWTAWYVLLLFAIAGTTFVAGTGLALLQELRARPRLVFGKPFVETRGVVQIPIVHATGDSLPGTIPASAFSASATGTYADAVTTTHFDDRDRPAFFAYIPVANQPRRRGRDAEDVHATLRFFDDAGPLLHEIRGRWAEIVQHGSPERTLRGEEITIPSNGSRRLLDVAFKYPEDAELFAFNDENRFLAPKDLRYRSLGRGPVRVEVTLRGSNVSGNAEFVLRQSESGRLEIEARSR